MLMNPRDYRERVHLYLYTHVNRKKATQFTCFVENKYRHEHVMITKVYIVSHILYNRHLYECIL